MKCLITLHIFLLLAMQCLAMNCVINPLNYGILEVNDPIERYYLLRQCHVDAINRGCTISYEGIDTLYLVIPKDAVPLPITDLVNFADVTIIVNNTQKDCFLFSLTDQMYPISISGKEIDKGNFRNNDKLSQGSFLLIIEDSEPWCSRSGYDTKVKRKDAMIISNGRASNPPITSYCTPSSKPIAKFRPINKKRIVIKNLNFIRAENSTFKTYCLSIVNQCFVELNNIRINTPDDSQNYADKAIYLENCVDVSLNDVSINGTYSQKSHYGYGICLMNVCDLKITRMFGRGNWGVFGTHCLNRVVLRDCDINRFDIHCYGKDVKAIGCKFSQLYNQFSSVYGTIEFDECSFVNFRPVLIESSYNAYTHFDLIWRKCTFYLDKNHNYLLTLFGVPEAYNERQELCRKNLPNIEVIDCKVVLDDNINTWYLIYTGGVMYKDSFDGITKIIIKRLRVVNEDNKEFKLFSEDLHTTKPIKTRISRR